jgi:hypothetical protein
MRKGISAVAWATFIIVALLLILAIVSVIFAPAIMRSIDKNSAASVPQPTVTASPSLSDTLQSIIKQRITDELKKDLPGKVKGSTPGVAPVPTNQPAAPPPPSP